ncbi:MAG TPA: SRPBCC family protein [Terriglobales bacterium]|nr:SRPBCC family protein [Terriglobales bacterium]
MAAGAALAAVAKSRRGWSRWAFVLGSGYLVYRGVTARQRPETGAVRVAFTIEKSPEEVFRFLSEPSNWRQALPEFTIDSTADVIRIKLQTPAAILESDAEITDRAEGSFIAWRSLPGALEHRGVVRLRPAAGNRGTELSVAMEYAMPAGAIARGLASLSGHDPEQLVRETLRRIKQLLEAGEIPTTAGQPSGHRGAKGTALRFVFREQPGEIPGEPARLAGD